MQRLFQIQNEMIVHDSINTPADAEALKEKLEGLGVKIGKRLRFPASFTPFQKNYFRGAWRAAKNVSYEVPLSENHLPERPG